ncbi:MAG TPA: sugar phosphate isomerase/epimerase [Devosia sp.]|jgi:inosose dehydratase|uniref:sugar phosphate isomerase/epimerase family protein n=1 Tax=Devosia sp. TaxID=1871048 RepID=UPI002DDD9EA5|nr:sugar phosphate isomerase/epimerase [Devosia sp.]HEV2518712.1 sugar phosphate isomerase/epimerase [Devosia sp.]
MFIGNAPCSWGINYPTGNAYTWQEYLDQVAASGYRGTELGPFGFLPKDKAELGPELEKRGLTLIGATHVHTFGDRASAPVLMSTLRELAPLLKDLGAKHLVIMDESNWYPEGQEGVLDREGWNGLTATVREAQAVIEGEFGLKASFHPHIGTAVEFERQIDRLLEETQIDLCFDTGHHAFWDQDPLAYMEKVWGRIAYMHLKNVDPTVRQRVLDGKLSVANSYGQGVMAPLPDGAVDIRAVMRFLDAKGFDGPIVVEQDVAEHATETPLQLAKRNYVYMQAIA